MMIRNIFASIAGAIIVFIWASISWMLLPWHHWDIKSFKDGGSVVTTAIEHEALESGIYSIPNISTDIYESDHKHKEWEEKAHKGPFVFLSVKLHGMQSDMTMALGIQLLAQFITAIIGACILSQCAYQFLLQRALFLAFALTAGTFSMSVSHWNWWGFPTLTTIVNVADMFVGWFFAGLIMAKIVKKAKAKAKAK